MTFNPRVWTPIATILAIANLVSVWFAARMAEPWHASLHALVAVLFALWAERLAGRR